MGRILRGALSGLFARLFGPGIVHWFEANPWIWWVIVGAVAFVGAVIFVATASAEAAASAAYYGARDRGHVPTHGGQADNTELVYWQSIANSTDPADFIAYLDEYPMGSFTTLAHNRLDDLERRDHS